MQSAPLTFGELAIGDRFISFPLDGDDSGHGGFRGGSYLFEKVQTGWHTSGSIGATALTENAKRLKDGIYSSMPPSMRILKVL